MTQSTVAYSNINFMLNETLSNLTNSSGSNATVTYYSHSMTPLIKSIIIILCAIVFVIGVPGNIVVIYVLGIKKRHKSRTDGDAFIICLAVADLLASFCVPLVTIHDSATISTWPKWYLGSFMCYFLTPLPAVTLLASSWALVLISVDRYRVIARPFDTGLSTYNKGARIAFIWAISIIMNIPFWLSLDTSNSTCSTKTILPATGQLVLSVCNTVVGWLLPALILAVVYHKITRQLRDGEAQHGNTQIQQRQVRMENKKIVRMFTIIVCIYMLLTIPFAVIQMAQAFFVILAPELLMTSFSVKLYLVLPNVTALNSCVNPVVYARMHKEINRFLRNIWITMQCSLRGHRQVGRTTHQMTFAASQTNQGFASEPITIKVIEK